jgi:hypothetical protein
LPPLTGPEDGLREVITGGNAYRKWHVTFWLDEVLLPEPRVTGLSFGQSEFEPFESGLEVIDWLPEASLTVAVTVTAA